MFRGSVKGTGHPLHSSVSPSLPLPCITVCHHVSTGLYKGGQGKDKGKGCPVTRQVGTEGGATSIAVPLINLESGRKLHLPTNWRCTGLLLHLIILKDTNTHTHTHKHTLGRTSLDDGSTRRNVYLTTHNIIKRQTVITPAGFEPATPTSEWPQTYALDRAGTVIAVSLIGCCDFLILNTLRTESFKLFKRPFPGFLRILTL